MKILAERWASDPAHLSAFRSEIRASARLHHPNLLLVLAHGRVDPAWVDATDGRVPLGAPYLVLEYAGAGTLRDHLGAIAWPRLYELLLGILSGLAHAHARGVLHRDVKPDNVLLASPEGPPKLGDFGLAHGLELERGDAFDREFAGTPAYMSPEQLDGRWRDYGPWTDLYSVGCLAFALATGRPPFGRTRNAEDLVAAHLHGYIPALVPRMSVPRGFGLWVRKLLLKDPDRRCRRAADAIRALRLLSSDPTGAVSGPISLLPTRPESAPTPPFPLAAHGLFGLRPLPVLGRVEEQALLWDTLREVSVARRAECLVLQGPAGTGASALAARLAERAHGAGAATVLRASHSPVPASPDGLAPMLRRSLRCAGLEPPEVAARLSRAGASSTHAETLAGWLVGERVALADAHAGLRAHLRGLLEERPVVLRLEDALRDRATLAFVASLFADEAIGASPLLVVITATDEDLAARPDEATTLDTIRTVGLALDPLPVELLHVLAREVLGLAPALAAETAARAGGRPGEVAGYVQRALRAGRLRAGPAGLSLSEDTPRG